MPDVHALIEVRCPSTSEVIGSVPIAKAEDVAAAVARARAAQVEWAARPLAERCRVLRQVKDRIIDHTDEICALLSREQGKPRVEGLTTEILGLVDLIQYFTAEAERILASDAGGVFIHHSLPMQLRKPWLKGYTKDHAGYYSHRQPVTMTRLYIGK